MSYEQDMKWFQQKIDNLRLSGSTEADHIPVGMQADWVVMKHLEKMTMTPNQDFKKKLKMQLTAEINRKNTNRTSRFQQGFMLPVWALAVLMVIFVFSFILINKPAAAVIQKQSGYGYLPEYGFFKLEDAVILDGPVRIQDGDEQLSIDQGLSIQGHTYLWISGNLVQGEDRFFITIKGDKTQASTINNIKGKKWMIRFDDQITPESLTMVVLSSFVTEVRWIKAELAGLSPTMVMHTSVPTEDGAKDCVFGDGGSRLCVQAVHRDENGIYFYLSGVQNEDFSLEMETARLIKLIDFQGGFYFPEMVECDQDTCENITLHFSGSSIQGNEFQLNLSAVFYTDSNPENGILKINLPERISNFQPTPRVVPTILPNVQPVATPEM